MTSWVESVSRGLETITITGGNRTELAAAEARQNSETREVRSWLSVGESLRSQMAQAPMPTSAPPTHE